ncbi:MAG TPA: bifunctional riboflavin kinase/FAD synthetase [Clostridiales bacterium]|nr:bifunctional riboflavin kinase/FAD synthetase [Clostridiales bacterium]HPV00987.1 bifunctional riboflavin kinase/FAD synthetase [Clostridiales bacterium]
MKTIFGNDGVKFDKRSTAVGLGNFDGLHVGHMVLVNALINEARMSGLRSVVYTFTKHPENVIRKDLFTQLLTTVDKRIQILGETRLDHVWFDEFDEEYSRMEPEDFVRDILADRLGACVAVAGFNYRFGYMGRGDSELLKELGKKYGIRVIIIPAVRIGAEIVSSTAIREYVLKGDMEKVTMLLGRHYSIMGKVLDGKRIGRRIGFPTANLRPENCLVLPCNGVYLTRTLYDGALYNSVTNVGINPTFGETASISVETHILGFEKDIYENGIEVFFLKKLRDEMKFGSADELSDQINRDIRAAKEYFGITSL